MNGRTRWIGLAVFTMSLLMIAAAMAPEHLGGIDLDLALAGPMEVFPAVILVLG